MARSSRFMLLRRTMTVARKELRHITRSVLTLFLVTASPAVLLFFLANVFSFEVDQADLALMDLDRSRASRDYIAGLTGNDALSITVVADDYAAIDRLLVAGEVDAALVLPPGFGEMLHGQETVQVQVIVDGSKPIVAEQAVYKVTQASLAAAFDVQPTLVDIPPPFELRSRAWYNATLKSLYSMTPGLLGVVLALPALALSLSLTREKELGTLEGLMATPLEGTAYLLGKTSAYVLTGVGGLLLSWLLAVGWFRVPFRGELWLLILLTIAYFLASMGFSLFISTWISSQQAAMFTVVLVFFVPSFFLAGLIDPINREAPIALLLSTALPATHYIAIARGVFLKGVGGELLMRPTLILLSMALIAFVVSNAIFKKKLG